MLPAIRPTDLVQHVTESPAEGWSLPYECINPSRYDLLRQATTMNVFFGQTRNPKVQLLSQDPVTDATEAVTPECNFTEGTTRTAAGFGGLSVLTIYASR